MWHIISTPTRFESMETMRKVINYDIILHNMVVEWRLFQMPAEEEEFTEVIGVRSYRQPMWQGTVPMTGMTDAGDSVGTVAGRCALEAFKDSEEEHDLTKRLLMGHVWYHYSKMRGRYFVQRR